MNHGMGELRVISLEAVKSLHHTPESCDTCDYSPRVAAAESGLRVKMLEAFCGYPLLSNTATSHL